MEISRFDNYVEIVLRQQCDLLWLNVNYKMNSCGLPVPRVISFLCLFSQPSAKPKAKQTHSAHETFLWIPGALVLYPSWINKYPEWFLGFLALLPRRAPRAAYTTHICVCAEWNLKYAMPAAVLWHIYSTWVPFFLF